MLEVESTGQLGAVLATKVAKTASAPASYLCGHVETYFQLHSLGWLGVRKSIKPVKN